MGANAEALDRLYDRFWRHGDWYSGAAMMSPDIEWNGIEGDPTLGGSARGMRAVNTFFADWLDAWEAADVNWEIEELSEDLLLVRSRLTVKGKGSGLEYDSEIGQIWEFVKGKAVRERMYRTYDEARAVAEQLARIDGG
jgi:ketosteroid isomerase-like protein